MLCVKSHGLLPGKEILPRLLKENNDQYLNALRFADRQYDEQKPYNEILNPLIELIQTQLNVQLSSTVASPPANGNKK